MKKTISVWRAQPANTVTKSEGRIYWREREWTAEQHCRIIGEDAFRNNTRLRKVILPEHVKEIGIQSFGNTSLRMIEMAGIEMICREAFWNCAHLNRVRIPGTVNFIGKKAFAQCRRLEEVKLESESGCREIKAETFAECGSLKYVILSDTIKIIERRAFYKCVSLEKFHMPKALKEIGPEAFYQTALTGLELPDGLQKIGDSAFLKCNQLEYVRIPESVKIIEKWAFHGCNRLKVLEITHDPEEIGPWIINKSVRVRCKKGGMVEQYCRDMGVQTEYIGR